MSGVNIPTVSAKLNLSAPAFWANLAISSKNLLDVGSNPLQ